MKGARISYADDACVVDCVIRNLSLTGAALVVPTTVMIPETFTLTEVQSGTKRLVRSMWRKGDRMGVHFCGTPEAMPAPNLPRARRKPKTRRINHNMLMARLALADSSD